MAADQESKVGNFYGGWDFVPTPDGTPDDLVFIEQSEHLEGQRQIQDLVEPLRSVPS